MERFIDVFGQRWPEVLLRLWQHLELVGAGILLAGGLGFGSGLLLYRQRRLQPWLLGLVNIVQTVPGLALLAFLLPFTGIGWRPAVVALTIYGIMPILRNTLTVLSGQGSGLPGVGRALGLTPWQVVWWIQIPQGLPLLISGLRSAVAWSVGTATLGAFIGAGGLGEFINRGISLLDPVLLLLGAIPVALLALSLDLILGRLETDAETWREGNPFPTVKWVVFSALVALLIIGCVVGSNLHSGEMAGHRQELRIGTKNFGEQLILGELIAQYLETNGFPVARPIPAFQSTQLIHGALVTGQIDLYVEYLGTADKAILKLPEGPGDPMDRVRAAYEQQFHVAWLKSLGFSNTYAMIFRTDSAQGATKISDLITRAPHLLLGLNSEFVERADGFPLVEQRYGLHFGQVDTLDLGLLYPSLLGGRVDGIVGFSTDGQLAQPGLVVLDDDERVFARCDAVPVVRDVTLAAHPGLREALEGLAGRFDESTLRKLNAEIELEKKDAGQIARDYWQSHH